MPRYDYTCTECGLTFERLGGFEDVVAPCRCGGVADRQAVYRSQGVSTRPAEVPDSEPQYQVESQRKALRARGWDGDRAVEHIRKNIREDAQGHKQLDVVSANADL